MYLGSGTTTDDFCKIAAPVELIEPKQPIGTQNENVWCRRREFLEVFHSPASPNRANAGMVAGLHVYCGVTDEIGVVGSSAKVHECLGDGLWVGFVALSVIPCNKHVRLDVETFEQTRGVPARGRRYNGDAVALGI